MSKETGFTTMAGAKAEGKAPGVGVGMLGYAFMGKAHTNAYKTMPYMMYPPPAIPQLVAVCGRNGILSSHLLFGDHRRGWDFVSPGRGCVPF